MRDLRNKTIDSLPRWVMTKVFKNPSKYGYLLKKYSSWEKRKPSFIESIKDQFFR